jgi:hypothetical protein
MQARVSRFQEGYLAMDGNLFITVSVSLDHHAPPLRPFLFPSPLVAGAPGPRRSGAPRA